MSDKAYFIYGIARGWLGKLEKAATANQDSPNPEIAKAAHFLWDAIANFCDDEIIIYVNPSDEVEAYAFYTRQQDPNTRGNELYVNTLGSLVDKPGIGSIIINEVIQQARRIGFDEVTVHPDVDAVGFYKKLGFVSYPGSYDDEYLVYWIHEPTHKVRVSTITEKHPDFILYTSVVEDKYGKAVLESTFSEYDNEIVLLTRYAKPGEAIKGYGTAAFVHPSGPLALSLRTGKPMVVDELSHDAAAFYNALESRGIAKLRQTPNAPHNYIIEPLEGAREAISRTQEE